MTDLIDSGTCAERLRKSDLHTNELGHRKDFFQGGNSGFSRWSGAALECYCAAFKYNVAL